MTLVPMPRVETPDLEAARQVAKELLLDTMHFHELAMAEPFKAEAWVQERGRRLVEAVGWPEDMKVWTSDSNTDTKVSSDE